MKYLAWFAMVGLVVMPLMLAGCESKPPPEKAPPPVTAPEKAPAKLPPLPPPPAPAEK